MKSRALGIFLAGVILAMVPAVAGVVYEIEVKDHEQSPPKTESIQAAVEGRHLKMGIAAGGDRKPGDMIFRGDRKEMMVVDHENRTFYQIDQAAIDAIAGQMSAVERQMAEALKNVPEDKRRMVEEMMKQRMPPGAEAPERPGSVLRKTDERGDQNGYPCVKYEILRDGRKIRELWVTDWSNVEGGSDVVGAFESMADFFRELMESMPSFGQGNRFGDPTFEHMKEIGGFPVVTREFGDDGSLDSESSLRSAKRMNLDPDAFEPPSGYKRQEMFSPGG